MSLTLGAGPFGHMPAGVSNPPLPGRGWRYLEPSPRRIRGYVDDELVVDCPAPMLLFEQGRMLRYLFPRESVQTKSLHPGRIEDGRQYLDLRVGDRTIQDAGWTHEAADDTPDLSPYVAFYWRAMDRWMEEDVEAIGHPRDPYHRVDAVPSSRHVVVSIGGEVLAQSDRAVVIFETSLPARWYLPREDISAALEPSDFRSTCAYKGHASYDHVWVGDRLRHNLAWHYPDPRREVEAVRDRICFFNEQVDVVLDGQAQPQPGGPWANPDWWRTNDQFAASF